MMSLSERFLDVARQFSDRTAVIDPGATYTYSRLAGHAAAVTHAVASLQGNHVGIAIPSCAMFPAAWFGLLSAGKVPVPLNFLQEPAALATIVADAAIDTVLTVEPLRESMEKLTPNVLCVETLPVTKTEPASRPAEPDDLATILYTSGTSAAPKGVMLTHGNLLANVDSSIQMANYTADDVSLGLLPLFHSFGQTCTMLLPLLTGGSVVYLPKFAPAPALAAILKYRATTMFAVPSIYRYLVHLAASLPPGADFSSLRFCVSGGEALGADVAEGFQKVFGRPLMQGYGLTECSPVVALNPPDAVRPDSVGVPLSWAELKIVAEDDRQAPPGEPGELLIRGACVMKGYYNRPDETASVLDADGWLHTGDIAARHADGYVSIMGRSKELIISAGENISPGEIEVVINSHPAVLESAAIGMPDATRGEVPQAFVVLKPDAQATEAELLDHCRKQLARQKVPRRIQFRTELPHSLTGKILKRLLK